MIQHDTNNRQTHKIRKNSATAIETNSTVDCQFKATILKTDLTDLFCIAIALKTDESIHQSQKI